jgi:hypothetical protein
MQRKLLPILLLLTGIIYLASVFELDSDEVLQNYQKENHCYVVQHNNDTNVFSYLIPATDLPFTIQPDKYFGRWNNTTGCFCKKPEPDPPLHLYLHHHLLLI